MPPDVVQIFAEQGILEYVLAKISIIFIVSFCFGITLYKLCAILARMCSTSEDVHY